jgi:hypothetical protein
MVDMRVLRLNLVINEIFYHQMQQAQGEMEHRSNWPYSLISSYPYFKGLSSCNQMTHRVARKTSLATDVYCHVGFASRTVDFGDMPVLLD